MYCTCHGICTLSLLGAAIPMRFGNSTQHPETLRLPGTTTMNLSQALPSPQKKCSKDSANKYCAHHTNPFAKSESHQVARLINETASLSQLAEL